MNFLLEIDKSQYGDKIIETAGFGETLLFGGKILLIGVLTVFSVLCLIWICLSLFRAVMQKNSESGSKSDEPIAAVQQNYVPKDYKADDAEIIAVIAAAIAAAESEAAHGAKFKVVSFRRK